MSYTLLRVTEAGVVLFAAHRARFEPLGARVTAQFDRFAAEATPGVYALRAAAEQLAIEPRDGSRLFDGMPVRWAPSPFLGRRGRFPKPASPSAYDRCRQAGLCTLLTSEDGAEIYESCSAAVVGWDGTRLLLVPEDRPRVDSTAESALRESGGIATCALMRHSSLPLALVNAVAMVCLPSIDERPVFPPEVRDRMVAAIAATAQRP